MNKQGFTLIELLIGMSLVLLLAMGSWSLGRHFLDAQELKRITDEINMALYYAKIKAYSEGSTLYLASLSGNEDWSKGLELYELNKGQQKQLLYQWQWQLHAWQVQWQGVKSKQKIPISMTLDQALGNGRFILTNKFTGKKNIVVLNRMWRVASITN